MTLTQAIRTIRADANWGIWSELNDDGEFAPKMPARIDQKWDSNGGIDDGMTFFANGDYIAYYRKHYRSREWIKNIIEDVNFELKEQLETDRMYGYDK